MVRAFAAKFFKKIEVFNFSPVEGFKPVLCIKPLPKGAKITLQSADWPRFTLTGSTNYLAYHPIHALPHLF